MALRVRPRHLRRYGEVARLLVKHAHRDMLSSPALQDALAPYATESDDDPSDLERDAGALAADLERLGPTFIKLGQLLATRADLLPPPYLEALSRLHDKVEPFSFSDVEHIVESELGVRISRGFREFAAQPVAAASLGQVHRAVLRDGRPVAVKVQRPGIRDQVLDDMDALSAMAELLDEHTEVGRRYHFAALLEEFRRSLLRELDYRAEAEHLRILGANLARFPRIVVPQPVDGFTSSRVLTMEWVDGQSVGHAGPLAVMDIDGPGLLDELFEAYLQQVLDDGFFHADPHPGNVFLMPDGRLALIDVGMVARIPNDMQDDLVRLVLALADGRGTDVAAIARTIGYERDSYDDNRFRSAVADLVAQHQHVTLQRMSAGTVLVQLTRIAGENGLVPPPELAMLARALLSLDDVARVLHPAFDPNEALRRHAISVMRSRLLHSSTPGAAFAAALETRDFITQLPGRVNHILESLARGEFELRVQAVDERELMRGVQKLANRVTMGLLLASLVIGAALMMRVRTTMTLFGYPALAVVFFLIAAVGALLMLAVMLVADERRQ